MRPIPIGTKGTFETRVEEQDLANVFKDATLPPILATPVMVKFMENAALRAIASYLDENEAALGTLVNVRHIAATPVGRFVRVEAEVTDVDGTRIVFAVRAKDADEEIGAGIHERKVVDVARFTRRLTGSRQPNEP